MSNVSSTEVSDAERAQRDKDLYDLFAARLVKKDMNEACRSARFHRHIQTLKHAGVGRARLGNVLEVGCGCGFGSVYLKGRYDQYVGIDHSARVVDLAREYNGSDCATFEVADASTYVTEKPEFDTIFMIGVLHHLPKPVDTLRNLLRSAHSGARVIANEPHSENPFVSLARRIRARTDTDYSEEQDEYSYRQFKAILTDAGLRDVQLRPQGVLSTPFAEVVMPLPKLACHASTLSCVADRGLEALFGGKLRYISWNLVGVGLVE